MVNEFDRILKCTKCKQELYVPDNMAHDKILLCSNCGESIDNKYYKINLFGKIGFKGYIILGIILGVLYYGQVRKDRIEEENRTKNAPIYKNTYSSNNVYKSDDVEHVDYFVTIDQKIENVKLVLNVVLNERVNDAQFENLAYKIKNKYGQNSKNLYITYYLKGMQHKLGAYAVSHFNPNPTIKKFGFSDDDIVKLNTQLNNVFPNYKIVGKWTDEQMKTSIFIYSNRNQYKVIKTDLSGDFIQIETLIKKTTKGIRFNIIGDSNNAYYLLESNQRLTEWDNDGIIINLLKID